LKDNSIVFIGEKYLNEDNFYLYKDDDSKIKNKAVLDISKRNFANYYLLEYKKNLIQLIDFCDIYNSPEKIKSYSHLWKMYNHIKK
jgi:hypothetical protein